MKISLKLLFLAALATLPSGVALAQLSEFSQWCLTCHGEETASAEQLHFADGTSLPVLVNQRVFRGSVHGSLDCRACHTQFSDTSHPSRNFPNRFEFRDEMSRSCTDCHDPGGVHATMLKTNSGLNCVECHGAHNVSPIDRDEENCLGCHERNLAVEFTDGTAHRMFCDGEAFSESVHNRLRCVDCHFGFSAQEHPVREYSSHRDLTLALSESCRRCHFDKYTRTLESVHHLLLSQQNQKAPVCSDCHGSHSIQAGEHDKLRAAQKCKNCHEQVYSIYSQSVHGSALLSVHNQDVPICSDCHEAHRIEDPRLSNFRNQVPQMCGDCHANEKLMSKYGLSTAVLDSYLEDFHGVTLTLYQKQSEPARHIAVCTDCHGIHDIQSLRKEDEATVKASLLERCRQCHQDATANFPASWISHYEPTITRAPLVYLARLFYQFFIPFMVVGLVLQILLHIWRYAFNR